MTEELPEGWCWATVDQLVSTTDYGTSAKTNEDANGIPVLRMGNIVDGALSLKNLKYLPTDHDEFPKLLLEPGDLLFNRTNSAELVGKSAVYTGEPKKCSFASYLIRVKSKGMLPFLLAGYINSPYGKAWIRSVVQQQVGQANVNGSRLLALRVPVPPMPEQRRIVSKIEELTARSRAAHAALAEVPVLLEQFRQSVLASAFRGDLTADWREKHPDAEPASVLLDRIRNERRKQWEAKYPKKQYVETVPVDDTDLPELPEGWCWTCVDEITSLITSGSRDWSQYYDRGTGTFIMAQNVRPGRLDFSEVRQLVDPPDDNRDRERSQVRPGDLLITIVGANTGDLCPVTEELPQHYVCQSVALLRLVEHEIQPFVLRYFLRGSRGRKALEEVIYGQGRPHLGFDDLKVMAVPLAPIAEQRELLQIIRGHEATIDHVLESAQRCLDEAAVLDQSVLVKAFRGELVLQDPADEPAAALLARIRSGGTAATPTTPTRSASRGKVKAYILLLLRTWNKPLGREMLERGLVLMLNADVRRAILGRSKTTAKRRKKSNTPPQFVSGMDALLGEMLDDGQLVPGPEAGFFAEGRHGIDFTAAPQADLEAVRETAEAMKVLHKDKQQATDADIVSALNGEIYELVS